MLITKYHFVRTDKNGKLWSLINKNKTWVLEKIIGEIFELENSDEFYDGTLIDYENVDVIIRQAYLMEILVDDIKSLESDNDLKLKGFVYSKIHNINNFDEIPYFIHILSKKPIAELRFKKNNES